MAVAAKFRLQTKWWFWMLVFVLWSGGGSAEARKQREKSAICEEAPPWSALIVNTDGVLDGEGMQGNPMLEGRGKVLVVAFTSAASQHSLEQAQKLEALEIHFHGSETPDVNFILINSAQSKAHLPELLSKNMTMTIFQENTHDPVSRKLGGKKDYVFIYDKCGRLTFKIPFPMSIISNGRNIVESSVLSTYLDNICGEQNCSKVNSEEKQTANETREDTEDLIEMERRLEQLYKQWKEEKEQKYEAPTTPKPPLLNGLWSLYRRVMKHMPWASTSNDDQQENSVRKFINEEETTEVPQLAEESREELCNITQKSICRVWSKKKLDYARVCCNLHTCNRSTQYLQKHCRHYPEQRCKKVQLVLQCCNKSAENDSELDEKANTRASTSSHPKS